jgi:polyisoprenyl-phosphate glycosyltransferase
MEPAGNTPHRTDPPSTSARSDRLLTIVIPVFNDWASVALLIPRLDQQLDGLAWSPRVVLVDDGSTDAPGTEWESLRWSRIREIRVVTLRRNMGHQRAIAMGLAFVEANLDTDAVLVMDGDGEDRPEDVPRLLERLDASGGSAVVFAERTRRVESLGFRVLYACYRFAHRLLTGIAVRVGNFSVIPRRHLRSLVVVSEMWNHYAAAVFHARLPRVTVPTSRAARLEGRSKMDFTGLVAHGMSAMSVHSEIIGVRLLVAASVSAVVLVIAVLALAWAAASTGSSLPAWAAAGALAAVVVLAQGAAMLSVFALTVLRDRSALTFVPARDYVHFVDGVRVLVGPSR